MRSKRRMNLLSSVWNLGGESMVYQQLELGILVSSIRRNPFLLLYATNLHVSRLSLAWYSLRGGTANVGCSKRSRCASRRNMGRKARKSFWWALFLSLSLSVNLSAIYEVFYKLPPPPMISSVWCIQNATYVPCSFWRRQQILFLWLPNILCTSSQILYPLS